MDARHLSSYQMKGINQTMHHLRVSHHLSANMICEWLIDNGGLNFYQANKLYTEEGRNGLFERVKQTYIDSPSKFDMFNADWYSIMNAGKSTISLIQSFPPEVLARWLIKFGGPDMHDALVELIGEVYESADDTEIAALDDGWLKCT